MKKVFEDEFSILDRSGYRLTSEDKVIIYSIAGLVLEEMQKRNFYDQFYYRSDIYSHSIVFYIYPMQGCEFIFTYHFQRALLSYRRIDEAVDNNTPQAQLEDIITKMMDYSVC